MMNLDNILVNYVGDFGKYQIIQFVLLIIPCIFISLQSVSWTFTGAMLKHRCRLPGEPPNASYRDSPLEHLYSNLSMDIAQMDCWYNENASWPSTSGSNRTHGEGILFRRRQKCTSWVYDHTEITSSAIDRWDAVCERKPWRATVQSMYYIGQAIGSILFGFIGDRFGRKAAFVMAATLLCISASLMAIVPWIEMFGTLRLLTGLAHPGIFVVAVVIGMELVGPDKRSIGSLAANLAFSIGQICLAAAAYFLRDYQRLQLAISLPCFVFLTYGWLMPKSVRWLISQGRIKEADHILRRVAKINGRFLPDNWHSSPDETPVKGLEGAPVKQDRRYNFLDLFRTPNIRKWALIELFCWPAVNMVYYGITMDPSFLGGDRYVTFLMSAIIEIPGVFIAAAGLNRLGRKLLMMAGFTISGLFMMLTIFIPNTQTGIVIFCVVVAKMAITLVYTVIYAWTPELFPTVIRNQATGLCSMMARVGGVAASYMVMLVAYDNKMIVAITFGIISLIAAFLCFFQPETAGAKTLESIEEAENFGNRAKLWSFRAPSLEPTEVIPSATGAWEKLLKEPETDNTETAG